MRTIASSDPCAAIRDFWKAGITALGITGATLTTIYVEMAADPIVEIGMAELELGQKAVTAKYMVLWKQEGGRWLWDKDIWNMN